jgi:hypothetical protein
MTGMCTNYFAGAESRLESKLNSIKTKAQNDIRSQAIELVTGKRDSTVQNSFEIAEAQFFDRKHEKFCMVEKSLREVAQQYNEAKGHLEAIHSTFSEIVQDIASYGSLEVEAQIGLKPTLIERILQTEDLIGTIPNLDPATSLSYLKNVNTQNGGFDTDNAAIGADLAVSLGGSDLTLGLFWNTSVDGFVDAETSLNDWFFGTLSDVGMISQSTTTLDRITKAITIAANRYEQFQDRADFAKMSSDDCAARRDSMILIEPDKSSKALAKSEHRVAQANALLDRLY